jgi:4-hydroxy-tetrahydrodipicolinate reductase
LKVGRVAVFGLGPIGCGIARALLERGQADVVAAIDSDERLIGRDLGEVLGQPAVGVSVAGSAPEALDPSAPGVVVQATSSRLTTVMAQISEITARGWSVVSTCEELVYAPAADPALAGELHRLASDSGVTVVGTGVNPGFVMDVLPLVLTGACLRVDAVTIRRTVDTNQRRPQLQRKVGVTMTSDEFERRVSAGGLGHVGLKQSVYLIADRLGWSELEYAERLEPILADTTVETPIGVVGAGDVLGQHQVATLRSSEQLRISLMLDMYAGAKAEDRIEIVGEPPLTQVIAGGVNGDIATIAIVANLVPVVESAAPGLWTMADLLPLRCATGPSLERVP